MATHQHLYGSCACERNQYAIAIPHSLIQDPSTATASNLASVFFDNSAANRKPSPLSAPLSKKEPSNPFGSLTLHPRPRSSRSPNSLAPRPSSLVPQQHARLLPGRIARFHPPHFLYSPRIGHIGIVSFRFSNGTRRQQQQHKTSPQAILRLLRHPLERLARRRGSRPVDGRHARQSLGGEFGRAGGVGVVG
jgi:hypothetical protein